MSSELISTRVNSARLPDYIGKPVRLACKIIKMSATTATVQASDGGEITVMFSRSDPGLVDTYAEIIGTVTNASTIKMLTCVNLGQELDLQLVNDTVELIHDPRFYSRIFSST